MKKNYFMLAATAALFAACAETDLVNEIAVEETPQAISFETFAQKATRAEEETPETPATPAEPTAENSSATYSGDLKDHHTNFFVWGYKNVQAAYVFTAKKVNYTETTTTVDGQQVTTGNWGYSGLAYWDKAASSYEFYAAAPATDNLWTINKNVEGTQSDDYFTISNNYTVNAHNASTSTTNNQVTTFDCTYKESFKGVANAVDLMIADKKQVLKESFGSTVQLDFIHILSRLNVTVSKDVTLASQTVVLKSLTLYNVNNQGTFDESKVPTSPATLATGTHERWSTNNDVTTYYSLSEVPLKYVSNGTPTPNGATATPEYMLQALIMPQTARVEDVKLDGSKYKDSDQNDINWTEPYFTIVYTITDNTNTEQFSASYNLASAFGVTETNALAFNEGWQNTLNITIKPTAIVFDSKVATWAGNPVDQTIQ